MPHISAPSTGTGTGHPQVVWPPPPPPRPGDFLWAAGGLFSAIRDAFRGKGDSPGPGGGSGGGGSGGGSGPQVFVAGFGKHPGAEDHDDVNVCTEQLSSIKRTLYTNGIAGTIDSGEWDRLSPDERLPKFNHEFLWDRPGWVYCGRLWASKDAKGRARYPMVVCAQCSNVPRPWVLSTIPPLLAGLEAGCQAAQSSAEVRQVIEGAQATLRFAAGKKEDRGSRFEDGSKGSLPSSTLHPPFSGANATPPAFNTASAYDFLTAHPDLDDKSGGKGRGLFNLLYVVEKEMVGFRAGDDQRSFTTVLRMSRQLRVPACGLTPARAADLWIAALRPLMHPATSMLGIGPVDQPWIDLIIGEPTKDELFALLAARRKLPLTTDIPYTLDEAFLARSRQAIAGHRQRG